MATLKKILDKILEGIVIISMAALVLDVLWQVFTRKVLNDPSEWTEELAIFLLIWVALLGSAVALGRGAHLGIDYFVGKLSIRKREWTEILVFFLIAFFAIYVMLFGGADLVKCTLAMDQRSPVWNVRMGYVYLAVPVSGFFMVLYSLLGFVERVKALSREGS